MKKFFLFFIKTPIRKTITFLFVWLLSLPVIFVIAMLVLRTNQVPAEAALFSFIWGAIATVIFWKKFEKEPLSQMGFSSKKIPLNILIGFFASVAIVIFVTSVLYLLGLAKIQLNIWTTMPLLILIIVTLIRSTVEEIIFRGYFLHLFAKNYSRITALLTTSIIFGLIHIPSAGFNILGILSHTIWAAILALIMFRWHSIWLTIGAHIGWNFTMWYFLGLPVYGEHAAQSIYYTTLLGNNIITGGYFGIDASVIMIFLLAFLFVFFKPGKYLKK
ncbi:MAG: hypothetical protein A2233_00595 [Candidatus Kerfeldbacteria bacterium RIFOXYA2_FULL_38_24]|uniref:CAAX prenyl protease 2/Lysostaphin resistance protein A-like domain-containing protein n=1 Tax=Candidatus Kerfeldbacteria bacterium RIFOXYB2_FULL_38_14 TaxID=1798547 RepID=A0A1G2BBQ1_9BACT|nr:MAG: hypothetical protein A2233_00595 [Candidatus Kerfeldbacteria bacterium RIFOXYA2_FULL_38_24]OGY86658.1 MAG: hypothetical protein A2319_02885 [Candidatus Kerfeldbacteria bacterium RIFOXYB2_FULL_38_14]OGY88544.1 MAG: hypothetical protein A2458_05335 [Candidatus Kerfeldbacteria bacterium RIFOXYC2_FULL_38_9]